MKSYSPVLLLTVIVILIQQTKSFAVVTQQPNKNTNISSSSSSSSQLHVHNNHHHVKQINRRTILNHVSIAALALFQTSITNKNNPSNVALASGGATAGGAYLLSAKQRYNARVTAGVKAYLAIGADAELLMSGSLDLDSAKVFFATDEVGGYSDFSSAGYLLANAFRRSSSTAPDRLVTHTYSTNYLLFISLVVSYSFSISILLANFFLLAYITYNHLLSLPSVKKWKAFKAIAEELEKKVIKKKGAGAADVWSKGKAVLDMYLEEVELPSSIEI